MNSKVVINGEIEYWVSKTPALSKLFGENTIRKLLVLCEEVTENHPLQEKLIMDFISGLALLHYSRPLNAQNEKEIEIRTSPVLVLIMKRLESDEYRKCLIDNSISGERVLQVNDVTIPITAKEILLYIKSEKSIFPITPKDIRKIQKDFVLYTRDEYNEDIPMQPKQTSIPEKRNKTKREPSILLVDAFETTSKYIHIMDLLVEKKYCNTGNYIWVNEKDSNSGTIIYLLKYLHTQGYYKENKKLTNKEIVEIAQNTFGITISESHAKQCKLEDNKITELIPLATTIK